ncbi:MAG: hypothetical protein A2527_00385 [Candidatus Lambdaproteobacteria bacterium RIFOXYD2_FULL_50_16]|uniref:V-type ATP synthase subunit D n=1 Tax=Candidatus Lambdaproteobacteria bacterium RIFOXYD2_FULL_50_16 TaxID=1817772 RepID=A0A1F6GFH9_9PROT|nr:MAG: hypothetical protein A2527_00385 [Candidatus Lambdaproteobacteria bacterium RIFOXYD2_FULL_50_16]
MAQLKLTKTELKTQKDRLKAYRRFLPTLQVKKQLLQKEILLARATLEYAQAELATLEDEVKPWIACFGEEADWESLIKIEELVTHTESIAGIEIRRFEAIKIKISPYNLYIVPLWVDGALEIIERFLKSTFKARLAEEAMRRLQAELTVTTQRVNLFEKVKIPEAKLAINKITTYLDDQARVAVGWARGAKKKLAQAAEGL